MFSLACVCALMERCWQHEPSSRPSFSEILDTVERIAEDAGVAL